MTKSIKTISIVIPVYNEGKFIFQTLQKVAKSNTLKLKKQIIVIDDGSKDNTVSEVKRFQKTHKLVKLFLNKSNLGKGASCKKGFLKSTGDLIIIQDADLEYSPDDYPTILAPFFDHGADVVYGSRFVTNKPHRVLYYWHYVANKLLTALSNILTNLNFTDMETGYKVFKQKILKQIAPKLESKRFGIEAELTAKLAKLKNIKIYEVGISYTGRSYEEGKKIGWKDGIKNILEIFKYNMTPNKNAFQLKIISFLNKERFKTHRSLLVAVLFVGILLRTLGLFWGLNTNGIKHGSPYHDEGHVYHYVLDSNYFYTFGEYEISKPVYIFRIYYRFISNILDKLQISPLEFTSPYKVYSIVRSLSATFGILSIVVVYFVSLKLYNKKVALFASAVYTLLPGQWFMSQLAKGEAMITFLIPLMLYLGYLLTKSTNKYLYILTGAFLGLALATKATFLIALPAFALLNLLSLYNHRHKLKEIFSRFFGLYVSALIVFRFLYPYPFCCLENYKKALNDPQNAFQRTSVENYKTALSNIKYVWERYESKEYPFFTLAFTKPATNLHLLGILAVLIILIIQIKKRQNITLLLSLLITYVIFYLSLNQYGNVNEDRYVVPLAPFVAFFCGAFFYLLEYVFPKGKIIYNFSMILILGYMFYVTFTYFYPYAISDPRTEVASYLDKYSTSSESVFIYIPSSRDKLYLKKDRRLIYTYEKLSEIEKNNIKPDYIVIYRTINHNGRWGSYNFIGEITQKPYGEYIPKILKENYNLIATFGKRPSFLEIEFPETYITPTYNLYKLR